MWGQGNKNCTLKTRNVGEDTKDEGGEKMLEKLHSSGKPKKGARGGPPISGGKGGD